MTVPVILADKKRQEEQEANRKADEDQRIAKE